MKASEHCLKVAIIGIFVFTIALAPVVQAQAGSIEATLTDDTYYGSPYQVIHGSEPVLKVSRSAYITFLKFNISNIPEGAMDTTAVLELYTEHEGVPSPRFVAVFPIDNETWTEQTYTPDDFLERYFTEKVVQYVTNEETWYEWNVTDIIAETVSNSSSLVAFAVMYDTSEETDPILFTSKEGSMTKMPKLTVFWESIIPDLPPNLIMLLIVMVLSVGALVFNQKLLKPQNHRFPS